MEWAVGMRSVRKASGAGPTYMCCETNSCLESGAGPTYMCCETNSCLEKQCEPLLSKRSHAMIGASCEQWTHWDLNPGPSACEADVIPLHHVPSDCQGPLLDTQMVKLKSKMPAVPHHDGGAVELQGWTGVPLARHAPPRLACYRSCG